MATDLVETFEDRRIEIPADPRLRDDLRRPEKVTRPGGRVSIAASRDGDGHADRFWSLALAVRAGRNDDRCRCPLAFDPLERCCLPPALLDPPDDRESPPMMRSAALTLSSEQSRRTFASAQDAQNF